uniref:Uncharacterized protein n=1 Tax=Physcomitrium patens TaxID=3218 RepID=A0A7I4ATI1_PHYPA
MQQIAPALFGTDIHDRVLQKGFKINARTVNAIEALFAPCRLRWKMTQLSDGPMT